MDNRTEEVLDRVRQERVRQRAKYGDNLENPDGTGPDVAWLEPYTYQGAARIESDFRFSYEDWEDDADNGPVTWVHLVREEVAEAFKEADPARLAEELVQVAALCVSWMENLALKHGV